MILKFNSISNLLNSFSYTNSISNGNFASTTGWTATDGTITASNNTLTLTGTGTAAAVVCSQSTSLPISTGKKIFMYAKIKPTNSDCTALLIRANGTTTGSLVSINTINTPTINTEYILSGIFTVGTQTGNLLFQLRNSYATAATSLNKSSEIKEVFAIDLTTLYGAGNEPSAASCLSIFRFVDGTKQPNFSKQIAT